MSKKHKKKLKKEFLFYFVTDREQKIFTIGKDKKQIELNLMEAKMLQENLNLQIPLMCDN